MDGHYLIGLALLLLLPCAPAPAHGDRAPLDHAPSHAAAARTVTRNGYSIEIFDSAEDQLRYARTWFSDPNEKRAALEALIEHYPQAKSIRAEAELELAYLALGADYRFADETACRQAIAQYRQIAVHYAELPAICAKAHWYIGWIYADLLRDPHHAVVHYQTIVDRYPDATHRLEPPVPWVSLVLPQVADKPQTVYERPVYSWRSMALLEIIRNTGEEDDKWAAFERLWLDDLTGVATGHALRVLLQASPCLAQKASDRARYYLQARLFSRSMAAEIGAILSRAPWNPETGPCKAPEGMP